MIAKSSTKTHTKNGKCGYRLHDERIAFSRGTNSIRSIKYELKDPIGIDGLRDNIADAIVHDNKCLYGNVNLNDYLSWRFSLTDKDFKGGSREISFLGFWIKALSLGFVFSNKIEFEFKAYRRVQSEQERLFNLIPDSVRRKLDKDKWCAWFAVDVRVNGKSKKSAEEQMKDKLKTVFLKEYKEDYVVIHKADQFATAQTEGRQNDSAFRKQLFEIYDNQKEVTISENKDRISVYWACDPEFNLPEIEPCNSTLLLDAIIAYWNSKVGELQAKIFLGIGESGNHLNNGILGRFFELCRSDDSKLKEAATNLAQIFQFQKDQEDEIFHRFKELSIYTKKLPAKPLLIERWADYRGNFNGILESWHSNRVSKQEEAVNQLAGLMDLMLKIKEALPISCDIKEGVLAETLDFIKRRKERTEKIDRVFSVELDVYLATLKSGLNEWAQQNKDEVARLPKEWQKNLSKRIQSSPLFFGESKRDMWEQIFNLKNLIDAEITKLENILADFYTDVRVSRRQVDMLAQLYQRLTAADFQGNRKIVEGLEIISQKLSASFHKRDNQNRFFIYGSEIQKNIKMLSFDESIMLSELFRAVDLVYLYREVKEDPLKENYLRDVISLSKILISAKVATDSTKRQREVVLIHSNLSGYASLISKRQFIARYAVQSTNGEQCLLSIAEGQTKSGSTVERYFFAFPDFAQHALNSQRIILRKIIKGNAHHPDDFYEPKSKNGIIPAFVALQVYSSRYQIQFLDWFFGNHPKKKNTLIVGGGFSIAEKEVILDWTGWHPTASVGGEKRVFVSQPFTIVPDKDSEAIIIDREQKIAQAKKRFLGVDIGEYGLAWSLIEPKGNFIEEIKSGFIVDRQQQALKDEVKSWRNDQARQTFTSPDTKVARIRESLIGSYRNKLEQLALRENATLSFEYEVSGLEEGRNKVEKVYNSIKRSVVRDKENYSQIDQAWGKHGVYNWAQQTTAAGTSQFCTKCKRWSSLAIKDTEEYELFDYQDNLASTRIADGEVRLLKKRGVGSRVEGREMKKMIYKAMRPNMKDEDGEEIGQGMIIVQRIKKGSGEWSRANEFFGKEKPRGNMAIFICPYLNCHHIADADKQAAFNIAVRGYLKTIYPERAKKKGEDGLNAKFLVEEAQKLDFKPVELFL